MTFVTIGQLAALTQVKVPTIRFYEQIGLLQPMRTQGQQRRYDADSIKRLRFIRHARNLGFDVDEIKALINLAGTPDASCKTIKTLARLHVEQIDLKLRQLRAMRRELIAMIESCHGPRVRNCRILEALAKNASGI